MTVLSSFFPQRCFYIVDSEKIKVLSFFKIVKIHSSLKTLKNFLVTWSTIVLKIFLCNDLIKICGTIFVRRFIELWTLGSGDEMLGFFEFLSFNPYQSLMKWQKSCFNQLLKRGDREENFSFEDHDGPSYEIKFFSAFPRVDLYNLFLKKGTIFHMLPDVEMSWKKDRIRRIEMKFHSLKWDFKVDCRLFFFEVTTIYEVSIIFHLN